MIVHLTEVPKLKKSKFSCMCVHKNIFVNRQTFFLFNKDKLFLYHKELLKEIIKENLSPCWNQKNYEKPAKEKFYEGF